MAEAEVGDDVFGEDPTVKRLQESIAHILGKEAALFVPSGVMGNQIALKTHTIPGDEVLIEKGAHIGNYESGAAGAISGVQLLPVKGKHGLLVPKRIRNALRGGYYWEPRLRLICVENTHNKAGGTVYPLSLITEIAGIARERGLAYHLDGARIWNAAIASGESEKDISAPFDSVCVCLSKGLGAPVGSVLAGTAAFIEQAHRYRKMLGGGMRQVGILAAAGLYALQNNRSSLAEDHEKAQILADGLSGMKNVAIDREAVQTNIVMFDLREGLEALPVLDELRREGVAMVPFGPQTIRATMHRDVSVKDIHQAVDLCAKVLNRA